MPVERADLNIRTSTHRVGIVDSGWRALALRIHLIRSAEHTLELQTFIWTEDEVGKLIGYELVQAAGRGVRVRVLSDGLHTRVSQEFAAYLATDDPHLELRQYNPSVDSISASGVELLVDSVMRFGGINQRAHDKLMIVDQHWALLGGRNLENTYFDYAAGRNFQDREVLVEGEVVVDALQSFERFWNFELTVPTTQLSDVELTIESGEFPHAPSPAELGIEGILADVDALLETRGSFEQLVNGEMVEAHAVAFCCDQPGKRDQTEGDDRAASSNHVTRALAGLVRNAEESVLVQTPYFILSDNAIKMVKSIRKEHPDIVLRASTNSLASTDIFPAQAAAYRQKHELLEHLEIHLYEFKARPGDITSYIEPYDELVARTGREPTLCMHSKSVVIDDLIAGIGSHNMGPRSTDYNTEIMLLVWDEEFASVLERSIERDIAPRNSWVVWKRERTPVLGEMLSLVEHVSDAVGELTTLDLWPSFYASSYELREGAEPVPPGHADFYDNYREVGLFPGVSKADEKLWFTQFFKAVGGATDPLL